MVDVLKCQLLGEVEYAQHNFARLSPLLYSLDGRRWDGVVERSWFPDAGLVFSLAPDLRFAPPGSLWTFQVKHNERQIAGEGKDVFMTIQVKPANRFMTELDPMAAEDLRVLATQQGFDPRSASGGALLPELDDTWVLVPEWERGSDGLARVTNPRLLPHMRVLKGTPEEIAGLPTSDGRWVLPVISSGHGSEMRNWRPPAALVEQLAADLRRWLPHAPHRAKAAAAAQALREIAPHLGGISAVRSPEVKAALARVHALVEDSDALTGSIEEMVKALLAAPAIAMAIEQEKEAMRLELETMALESAERLEAEARERVTRERAEVAAELERSQVALSEIQAEIAAATNELAAIRKRQQSETAQFTKSLEALIARARTEPAAYAAEWLGRLGLSPVNITSGAAAPLNPDDRGVIDQAPAKRVGEGDLGRLLSSVAPIRNEGLPRFMLMDVAVRARELVVGIGPGAREAIESWLSEMVVLTSVVRAADPSLLCFADLLPSGARGAAAPLAKAIDLASQYPNRPVVGLLDDVDGAAGSYWLPETARAGRQPTLHGLPSNLFLIALIEGDANALSLSATRAGELFPLRFDDAELIDPPNSEQVVRELELSLFEPPLRTNGRTNRLQALRNAAGRTFNSEDVQRIGAGFDEYLKWTKLGHRRPSLDAPIGGELVSAAALMISGTTDYA